MKKWMGVSSMVSLAAVGALPVAGQLTAAAGPVQTPTIEQAGVMRVTAPRPWAPQDPADSIYREARRSLNDGAYREAAGMFAQLRTDHPRSEYAADAFYYEAFALYRMGSRSDLRGARDLLGLQAERHPDAATRDDADELLVRIDGQLARSGDAGAIRSVTSQAVQSCEEGEQELKSMALSALMGMDSERAVPILRDVLQDRSECSADLRAEAVFILGQKMTDDVVPLMVDLAVNNPDPSDDVREAAVFALSQVRSPEATAALEQILTTSDDVDMQEQALFALSQGNSPRAGQILRDYASNPNVDSDLRETAIFWVGQRGGEETFDFLDQIFRSTTDQDVKEAVAFAMTQSGDDRVSDWLLERVMDPSESDDTRENALFWYGQQSDGVSVATLMDLYRAVDGDLKESVLFSLSQRQGDDEALEALIEIARTEEDPDIVENALFWLGQSDDPRAAEVLLEIIRR